MRKKKIVQPKTHKELVEIGYRWLGRAKDRNLYNCYGSHSLRLKEISNATSEEPDVIGFRPSGISTLIECKATRSDFLSDKKKTFRKDASQGMGYFRFYLVNDGIIDTDELPDKWGLLVSRGRCIKIEKDPLPFEENNFRQEAVLLAAMLRRVSNFNLMDLINDARYKEIPYEWDE